MPHIDLLLAFYIFLKPFGTAAAPGVLTAEWTKQGFNHSSTPHTENPPEQSNQSCQLLIKSPQESVGALEDVTVQSVTVQCPQTQGQQCCHLPLLPIPIPALPAGAAPGQGSVELQGGAGRTGRIEFIELN